MNTSPKTVIVYHDKCFDGLGALWAVLRNLDFSEDLDDEINDGLLILHAANYGQEPPDVAGCDVIMVDFSYPRDVMEQLIADANSFICLDHHKTAQEALAGLPGCHFDMDQSGAGMAWRHFAKQSAMTPYFLSYIEDRDIWRKALPWTEEVNAYIGSIVDFGRPVLENLYAFDRIQDMTPQEMAGIGGPLRRVNLSHVESCASMWFFVTLKNGVELPCVLGTAKVASEVGNLLCAHTDLATALVITSGGAGRFGMSFRSTAGKAAELAKLYGGGGHLNAAGASLGPDEIGALLATRRERPESQ